jgi:hypothetical protein
MKLARVGSTVAAAGLLAVLVGAPTCTAAAEKNIEELVQNAKTPADHEAIAKLYDEEAATARSKAEEHRKMGAKYTHFESANSKTQGVHFDMPKHCQNLTKSYEQAAKEAEAMAAAHREAAKNAK